MVTSRPCIDNLKRPGNPICLSFASKVFAGLRAALCSFHGSHEGMSLCLLAPNILFDVAVVSRTQYLIANLHGCEPYSASVYLFLCSALGLPIVSVLFSSHGLSRLCEA